MPAKICISVVRKRVFWLTQQRCPADNEHEVSLLRTMHTQWRAEMRIDDKNLSSAGAASLGRTQAAEQAEQSTQRAAAERSGVHGQSDQVQLSSLAETVQALEPDSAANRARLDELSKLVASGEYSPDAESIAGKLIEESIEPKSPGLIE